MDWPAGWTGLSNWCLHHNKKSIACKQVTSKSTKAPFYSATSLVYKQKLICHGAGWPFLTGHHCFSIAAQPVLTSVGLLVGQMLYLLKIWLGEIN
jgi:hypothetical protein